MGRYMQVLRLFWSTSLATEMEYRLNFILAAISSLGNLAGSIFLIHLMFRKTATINGWTQYEAILVIGLFTLLEGFANTVLRANLSRIVRHVRQGTLDFVLLKPIDSQFWLSTRNFSAWGVTDLLWGLIVIGYAGSQLGLMWWQYLMGLIPLALGLTILYGMWFMLGATSIWFVKVFNVTYVLKNLLEAGKLPIAVYPVVYQFFFTFVIPVAFLTTVPARAMLGDAQLTWLAGAVFFAVVMFTAARYFWKFALRFYTSASS